MSSVIQKVAVFTIDEDTEEIRALLHTLNVSVVDEFRQKRTHPHTTGYFGPGKITEVKESMKCIQVDAIVINGELKPSQHHYLEMEFQKECLDRTGVILRIFSEHAHTQEAIAQVTLAKLRYELPFLREWIHKAKSGDRPGFLAGGAYATDVYYEHAKTQARRIEKNLELLSSKREITRAKRREMGFTLVSLAGYTNAGKSAILNQLSGSSVEVDDRLFSTLSTTTRRLRGTKENILLVDTVGFIKDLPPHLVDAFNSTLEEIFRADLILLVFDASEGNHSISAKLKTSLNVLKPRLEHRTIILIGNKIDLMTARRKREVEDFVKSQVRDIELIMVSARNAEAMPTLHQRIRDFQQRDCVITCVLPMTDESYSLLSSISDIAEVEKEVVHTGVSVKIICESTVSQKIMGRLASAGATRLLSSHENNRQPTPSTENSTRNEGAPLS